MSCPDSDARIQYYGVTGYPTLVWGGTTRMVGAGTDVINGLPYRATILSMLPEPTHFKITVNSVTYDPGFIDFDVEVMENVPDISNMKIRMAVIESGLSYGGTAYDNVLLDMLADEPLTVGGLGESQNVQASFDPGTVLANMQVIIFIQDDTGMKVYASTSSLPTPDYSLRYYALGDRQVVGPTGTPYEYDWFRLYNAGNVSDTFNVTVTGDLPDGWAAVLCDESQCYGPVFSAELAPGEYKDLHISVTAFSSGYAPIDIELTQDGIVQEFPRALGYTYFTNDLDVLLVDDDGAEAYEEYFIDALDFHGYNYGVWNRNAGAPSNDVINSFPAIVWNCGWAFPTVDEQDRAALSNYLDNGGALFITGQDIGWELQDIGGAAYQWYQDYLHAVFVSDDTNSYNLSGVPGDPITDGLDIVIQGGDGANNQQYPSDIDPADGSASVIWTYDSQRNGAIKADTGTYRVVYLAFGYEAIDNAGDRRESMNKIMQWLLYDPADVPGHSPEFRAFFSATPNPVTTTATLRFTLPQAGQANLKVYGPDGRVMRTLLSENLDAGTHSLEWDGTDSRGGHLPAGIYYYRLEAEGVDLSRKTIVLN